jgi:hypothetical protein
MVLGCLNRLICAIETGAVLLSPPTREILIGGRPIMLSRQKSDRWTLIFRRGFSNDRRMSASIISGTALRRRGRSRLEIQVNGVPQVTRQCGQARTNAEFSTLGQV